MKNGNHEDTGLVFRSSQKPLVLQQRRLCKVDFLGIRNLTISLPVNPSECIGSSHTGPLVYFTISNSALEATKPKNVFVSEKMCYSTNPTWSYFEIPNNKSTEKVTDLDVRLWIGQDDSFLPALHWNLNLGHLCCIGKSLFNDQVTFHSNSVIIGLNGLYYANNNSVTLASDFVLPTLSDYGEAGRSYSVCGWQKLLAIQCSMAQKQSSISENRREIQLIFEQHRASKQLRVDLENMKNKVAFLQKLLKREKAILANERLAAKQKQASLQAKRDSLDASKEELESDLLKHKDNYSTYISTREAVTNSGSQLGIRRRNILSQLSDIFPITKRTVKHRNESPTEVYSICGAVLPDAEHLNSKEDIQTVVALNYTAQLLTMISQFLLIPLRYPLAYKGANLMIVDQVTDKLTDKERMFPLHVKGNKDRFLFEYGVFLLNKNVAQLRYYFSMGTSDLRLTLSNIHSLLVERLGTKAIFHSAPILASHQRSRRFQSVDSGISTSGSEFKSRIPLISIQPQSSESTLMRSSEAVSLQTFDSTPTLKVRRSISSTETSPIKAFQRVGHKSTELTSLRGELFGTKPTRERTRDPSPSSVDHHKHDFEKREKSPTLARPQIETNHRESADSISPTFQPQRFHLTGLEEIGQSHVTKPEPRLSKDKLASARAELLGKKSTTAAAARWGSRSSSKLSDRTSSSASSNSTPRTKADSVSSRDRSSSSFSEDGDVTTTVAKAPSKEEQLPYMSAITGQSSHFNGVDDQKPGPEIFVIDHVTAAADQSADEIDLC